MNSPQRADRRWFACRPRRSHRLRDAMPGEFDLVPPAGHKLVVAVRQLAPGVRLRTPFFLRRELSVRDVPEGIAAALFDLAHGPAGEFTGADVRRQAQRYSYNEEVTH